MSATGIVLEPYRAERADEWNAFVARSRNGTFLFDRGFMDYHAQRFADASLMAVHDARLIALLPAHRSGRDLLSHGGLTYGGFVVDSEGGMLQMQALFASLLQWAAGEGIARVLYKTVPGLYHRLPSEDDRYALFRCGASLWKRDLLSVIPPDASAARSTLRQRMLKRSAGDPDVAILDDAPWSSFWPLLEQVLDQRHGQRPVHSLEEIQLLASRFPNRIRLIVAQHSGKIGAGVVLFETDRVVHAQYMAADTQARQLGLLDRVVSVAIDAACSSGRWFDFGISTEDGGRHLNEGLLRWKEGFGARTLVHDAYELSVPGIVDPKA
ncbi:MAG: family N-acetyltransferase [Hydrocarboniphaga sp.]|uniref:GNAT family N-acetyltransferase n=1 Tax=Hydrocarboniphaga sp. TaxID=2033016 RepID=UPI00260F9D2E|nr:GNAT family N-acetyltransferase [Hydrocarboniphaga sp.]MDB5971545.1 family N-acetyltransferase [Hydrocarboniphaga sp.]